MDPLAVGRPESLRLFAFAGKESCDGFEITSPNQRLVALPLAKPMKNNLRLPLQLLLETFDRERGNPAFVANLQLRRSARVNFGLR
jgi:hypothetical protein